MTELLIILATGKIVQSAWTYGLKEKIINNMSELEKQNLIIDLREINWILENRPNIMASEYVELSLSKREIIKRLYKAGELKNL